MRPARKSEQGQDTGHGADIGHQRRAPDAEAHHGPTRQDDAEDRQHPGGAKGQSGPDRRVFTRYQETDHLNRGQIGGDSGEEKRLHQQPEFGGPHRAADRPLRAGLARAAACRAVPRRCGAGISRRPVADAAPGHQRQQRHQRRAAPEQDAIGFTPAEGVDPRLCKWHDGQHSRAEAGIGNRHHQTHLPVEPSPDQRRGRHHAHQRGRHATQDARRQIEMPDRACVASDDHRRGQQCRAGQIRDARTPTVKQGSRERRHRPQRDQIDRIDLGLLGVVPAELVFQRLHEHHEGIHHATGKEIAGKTNHNNRYSQGCRAKVSPAIGVHSEAILALPPESCVPRVHAVCLSSCHQSKRRQAPDFPRRCGSPSLPMRLPLRSG